MSRMPGSFDEDEWYFSERERVRHVPSHSHERRPSRPRYYPEHVSQTFLSPSGHQSSSFGHGLHRSRSQGHAPAPNVTIYNTLDADQNPRISNKHTSPLPSPRGSPRGRPRGVADEWSVEDELAELRYERRMRDRSRSRPPYWEEAPQVPPPPPPPPGQSSYDTKMELELAKERLSQREKELEEDRIRDQMRKDYEYEREKEARRRDKKERDRDEQKNRILTEERFKREREKDDAERERRRIIDEENLRIAQAKKEADEMRQKARDEWERQEREAKEERKRAIEAWEAKKKKEEDEAEAEQKKLIAEYEAKKIQDAQKAKDAEETLRLKIRLEDEARKEKEEREYQEFLRKQREKEDEERRKQKEQEERLESEMTKRLAQFGFQNNQIQAMIKPEKRDELAVGLSPAHPYPFQGHQPTYPKIHTDYLSVDTLHYFGIPWEYDRENSSYIIILREMSHHETDMLFEHTKSLRERSSTRLLIEQRRGRDKPDYAWVRRKHTPSPHRRKSSPKRVVGIGQLF